MKHEEFELLLRSVMLEMNEDTAVRENIKGISFTFMITYDEFRWFYLFDNGAISELPEGPERNYEVIIEGTAESWEKIVKGLPGGMQRAFRHHLLNFSGEPFILMNIWKSIYKFGELLRYNERGEQI